MLASNILTYSDFLKDSKEPLEIRKAMVARYYELKSITAVALEFNTTRKTVRKWVTRFTGAVSSLKNQTTAPKEPYLQIKDETRELIIRFRKERPNLGYCYVVSYLNQQGCTEIPSAATVYAIWKKNRLLKRHYKKSEKKKDCRAIKQKYLAFEKIQIDVKELVDIPNYLDQSLALKQKKDLGRKYGLPMYQYTARDLKTGALFISLAHEHTRHNSAIFVDMLLTHLKRFDVVPRTIQTDNGTEFVNTRDALDDTLFKQVVRRNGITRHKTIPPGAKTWQSEVETSHWIIEKEFYDYTKAPNIGNLMKKFRAYQWGFNTLRKNGYRGNITPLESLRNEHNKNYATLPKEIMDFPSCILDKKFNQFIKGGYHVGLVTSPISSSITFLLYSAI
jgi:transposase